MMKPVTAATRLPRRSFVKAILVGTAFSALGGLSRFCGEVRAGDIQIPVGTFTLDLEEYPALFHDNGSIRFTVPGVPDVIVTRLPGNRFLAVTSQCTHEGCAVGTYDPEVGSLTCPCHGATYAPDGTVLGGPAQGPLIGYPVQFNGTSLSIRIYKLGFVTDSVRLETKTGGDPRLAITFDADTFTNYEISFLDSVLEETWAALPVPFATTPDGPLEDTTFSGDGEPVTLFVEIPGDSGFFVVNRYRLLGG